MKDIFKEERGNLVGKFAKSGLFADSVEIAPITGFKIEMSVEEVESVSKQLRSQSNAQIPDISARHSEDMKKYAFFGSHIK